jgi:peptide/nickel transport system permease protein
MQALRAEFGLDKLLPMQYADWVAGMFRGNFGRSTANGESVAKLMAQRFPVTIYLGILALIVSSVLGILAGLACAIRRGGPQDAIVTLVANFGISFPNFWLGILMIYLFGLLLGWLPSHGYTSPFQDFWLSIRQLVMPVFCLSAFAIGGNARQTRSSMLEVVRQDYIRTAWSKGLREWDVVMRHTVKNGLIPVVTLIGMQVRMLFGGQVVIETVFNIPGVGRLLVASVLNRDYAVVQSICLVIGVAVVLINLAVDVSYIWFDPRIQYD